MDAAIGDEADEVESSGFRFFECAFEDVILCDRAFGDGFVDAGEVLIDDAPGSEVEVADLGVPHLPFR